MNLAGKMKIGMATLVASVLVAAALVNVANAKPAGLGRCYGSVHQSVCVAFKKDQCSVEGYEGFYQSQANSCKYWNGRYGTRLGAMAVAKSGADSWGVTVDSPREFTDSCEFMHTGSCYNAATGDSKCIADALQCLDNETFRPWNYKEVGPDGISDFVCHGGCKQAPGKPFTEYGYCLKGAATSCSLFPSDCKSDEVFKKPGEQFDVSTTDHSRVTTTSKQDVHCPCYKVHTGGCKKNKVCNQIDWRCGTSAGRSTVHDPAGDICKDNGVNWTTLDPKPKARYTHSNDTHADGCTCEAKWDCTTTLDATTPNGVTTEKADQSIRCAAHSDQCVTEESWLEPHHVEMQLPTNPDSVCTLCEVPKDMNVNGKNFNKNFGRFAAIPGGYYNEALHENSLAFGGTHTSACTTTAHNQFKICSSHAIIAGLDIKTASTDMQRAGHGGAVLLNGVDIVDLKAEAGKNKAEASKNKASFEAEIAKLKATLDAASSEIIDLKKLVKDNHHDITQINQGGWIAALIVAIVALVAGAGTGMSLLVRKPTLAAPAGQTLDGKVGIVTMETGLPIP